MSRLTSTEGRRPLGIALVLSALLGAASAASAQDHQPLAVGDVRTYENGGAFGALQLERTEVVRRSGGSGDWYRVDHYLGLVDAWVASFRGDVYAWDDAAGRAVKLFDLRRQTGQGYRVTHTALPGGFGTMTLAARGETVVVPAGTFRDCVRFTFQTAPGVADAGWEAIWLAPGVGVVQWSEQSFAGPVSRALHSATIGGTVYPQPQPVRGGLTVAIQADKFEYSLPPLLPVATLYATFTFTVDNQTGTAIPVTYSSGQSFDFELSDSNGQVLKRWSDGRFFTMALVQGSLQGTTTIVQGMVLEDRSGQMLPSGDYKVRAWLTTIGGPVFEAATAIRVAR